MQNRIVQEQPSKLNQRHSLQRYYDPASANFLSRDTYRGDNDDYAQWNLYVYCANDPVNNVDLSGHKKKKAIAGFGLQLAFTKRGFSSALIAFDLVWFRDKEIEKYKNKPFHLYASLGGTGAENKEKTIVKQIIAHPKYVLNKKGARKLAELIKGDWAVSGGFFVILNHSGIKHYLDYEGWFLGLSVSNNNVYLGGGISDSSISLGGGYTTAIGFNFSMSAGYTWFVSDFTDRIRKVGKKIKKKVKKRAGC